MCSFVPLQIRWCALAAVRPLTTLLLTSSSAYIRRVSTVSAVVYIDVACVSADGFGYGIVWVDIPLMCM